MSDFKNILRGLKLKKALLLSEIDPAILSNYDQFFRLGKIEYEISITEREIVREAENLFGL